MKKVYFMVASLLLSAGISAQTIQNGSLETWTSSEPDSWTTLDNLIGQASVAVPGCATIGGTTISESVTQGTTGAAEGSSYAKIQSLTLQGLSAYNIPDGVYSNMIDQYIQTTTQYSGVAFQYQTTLSGTDATGIFVNATKWNTTTNSADVVAQGYMAFTSNTTGWTKDTLYLSSWSGTPDTIEIMFASSLGSAITGTTAPTPTQDGTVMSVDDVQFLAPAAIADPATNLAASDVSNNANGTDLQVTFNAAADESTVSEYRLFATATGYSSQLVGWGAIPGGNGYYVSVTPDGSASYTVNFDAASNYFLDNSGTPSAAVIVENVPLEVVAWSVPDGTNANTGMISAASNSVILTSATGLESLSLASNEVRVYPNPANSVVNFAFHKGSVAQTVQVFSLTGKLIASVPAQQVTSINVSQIDNGMYLYRVIGENNTVMMNGKFQVMK